MSQTLVDGRRSARAPGGALQPPRGGCIQAGGNAMVVLAGFLVLATSEFPPNHSLGVLVSLNMLVCFLGTVTLLAAALHRIQPAFVRPERRVQSRVAEAKSTG